MGDEAGAGRVDEIFEDLQRQILSGELAPGDRLPAERQLAQRYATHRHTLREATIRLEQQGLVTVRHGQGATVQDFRRGGHIGILAPFLEQGADPAERLQVLADLLPARVEVLAIAAQMACRRADDADRARLLNLSAQAAERFREGDAQGVAAAYHAWMDALVDAAHSLPVRWIANALLEVNARVMLAFPGLWVMEPTFPAHMAEVDAALVAGDDGRAVASMRAYFQRVDAALEQLVAAVVGAVAGAAEEPGDPDPQGGASATGDAHRRGGADAADGPDPQGGAEGADEEEAS